MLTCCPACATTFRITPEQLKAKLGRVRCGQCASVFNALDSLVEEAGSAGLAPRHNSEWEHDEADTIHLDFDLSAPDESAATLDVALEEAPAITSPRAAEAATPEVPEAPKDSAAFAPSAPAHVVAAVTEPHPTHSEAAAVADALEEPHDSEPSASPLPQQADVPARQVTETEVDPEAAGTEADATPGATSAVNDEVEGEPQAEAEGEAAAEAPVPLDTPAVDMPDTAIEIADADAAESATPETAPAEPATSPVDLDPSAAVADATALPPPPAFLDLIAPPRPRRWPWLIGVVLALALLLLQLALVFRVELGVLQPQAKPLLNELCRPFACRVDLPARPELLSIDASDLHPGKEKGALQLSATLKNRAPFAQDYPNLEVTLTDLADRPLIVRSLTPAEYLAPGSKREGGFAARSDLSVSLDLDVGDVPAVGYRLYLYYP